MTLTPASCAFCEHVGQRRAVDRGDHQDLGALGDHVLDLGELVRDVVVGILQVGVVALGLQLLDHVVAVVDPAGGRLGRHGDADRGPCRRPSTASGPCASTGHRAERHGRHHRSDHHVFLSLQAAASGRAPAHLFSLRRGRSRHRHAGPPASPRLAVRQGRTLTPPRRNSLTPPRRRDCAHSWPQ